VVVGSVSNCPNTNPCAARDIPRVFDRSADGLRESTLHLPAAFASRRNQPPHWPTTALAAGATNRHLADHRTCSRRNQPPHLQPAQPTAACPTTTLEAGATNRHTCQPPHSPTAALANRRT